MNQVDLFGDQVMPEQHGSKLGADWDYPPFSVWNARDGWWQDRKRAWLSLGIKSELGRGGGATWNIGTTYDGASVRCEGRPSDMAERQVRRKSLGSQTK